MRHGIFNVAVAEETYLVVNRGRKGLAHLVDKKFAVEVQVQLAAENRNALDVGIRLLPCRRVNVRRAVNYDCIVAA